MNTSASFSKKHNQPYYCSVNIKPDSHSYQKITNQSFSSFPSSDKSNNTTIFNFSLNNYSINNTRKDYLNLKLNSSELNSKSSALEKAIKKIQTKKREFDESEYPSDNPAKYTKEEIEKPSVTSNPSKISVKPDQDDPSYFIRRRASYIPSSLIEEYVYKHKENVTSPNQSFINSSKKVEDDQNQISSETFSIQTESSTSKRTPKIASISKYLSNLEKKTFKKKDGFMRSYDKSSLNSFENKVDKIRKLLFNSTSSVQNDTTRVSISGPVIASSKPSFSTQLIQASSAKKESPADEKTLIPESVNPGTSIIANRDKPIIETSFKKEISTASSDALKTTDKPIISFNFGSDKSENKKSDLTSQEKPRVTFSFPDAKKTPNKTEAEKKPLTFGTNILDAKKEVNEPKQDIPKENNSEKPSCTETKPAFSFPTFGANPSSNETKPTSLFSFGANAEKKTDTTTPVSIKSDNVPSFNFGAITQQANEPSKTLPSSILPSFKPSSTEIKQDTPGTFFTLNTRKSSEEPDKTITPTVATTASSVFGINSNILNSKSAPTTTSSSINFIFGSVGQTKPFSFGSLSTTTSTTATTVSSISSIAETPKFSFSQKPANPAISSDTTKPVASLFNFSKIDSSQNNSLQTTSGNTNSNSSTIFSFAKPAEPTTSVDNKTPSSVMSSTGTSSIFGSLIKPQDQTKPQPTTQFNFGGMQSADSKPPSNTFMFNFGAKMPESTTTSTAGNSIGSSLFGTPSTFNTLSSTANTQSVGLLNNTVTSTTAVTTTTASSNPLFGSSTSSSSSFGVASMFGGLSTPTTTTSSVIGSGLFNSQAVNTSSIFGGSSNPVGNLTTISTTTPATGGIFSFGSKTTNETVAKTNGASSNLFNFSGLANSQVKVDSPFGVKPQTTQASSITPAPGAFSFGGTATPAAAPMFSFGSSTLANNSTLTQQAPAQLFNFASNSSNNTASSGSTNQFTFGEQGGNIFSAHSQSTGSLGDVNKRRTITRRRKP